jgi:16S rRNA (guanine527-N7)-methyltransferase
VFHVKPNVFGAQLPVAERYAEILATTAVERGLLGPREVPRIWERHLINCGVVAPRIPSAASVADVGSGAGLPGLVWAIARPDVAVTLIEPLLRRATFLSETVETLGLGNVTVVRGRAEEHDRVYDVVTARAVASLDRLVDWCFPLVAPGGVLLALKGATAAQEVESARTVLERHPISSIVISSYGATDPATTVVEIGRFT